MYSMELKLNWEHKRCKHAIERMWLRGISENEIREAIMKGQKHIQQKSKLIESVYRFFSVIYDEIIYEKKLRKIYPVTVKVW